MKHLIIMSLAGLLMLSCRYQEAKHPAPAVNTFAVGQKFRITLPENHERKESWTLAGNSEAKVLTRMNDVWHGNEKGIDFNFQAASKGATQLRFVKRVYGDTVATVSYIVEITDN